MMTHRRVLLSGALLILGLAWGQSAIANLSIRPARIVAKLDEGTVTKMITVENVSDMEGTFRAQVEHFRINALGGIELVEPDENSLAAFLKLNPREFTLAPKAKRTVRLAIIPPADLDAGDYWAALRFEPLTGLISEESDEHGRTVALEVIPTILIPVYGTTGEVNGRAEVVSLEANSVPDHVEVSVHVANTGNHRLRVDGTCEIVDAEGAVVSTDQLATRTVLLRDGERRFVHEIEGDFSLGAEYMVRVRFTGLGLEEDLLEEVATLVVAEESPE